MSEFLSEDIHGYYSGLPEAQPWYTMQGLTSPYGVYGLNRAGLLAQQNLPVNASGMLNIGVGIDGQAIQDQVNRNLAEITDPEQIENILNPPQFVIGPGYTDQDVSKEPSELDPTLTTEEETEEETPIADAVEQATEAVTEGVSSAVQDAIDAATAAVSGDTGEEDEEDDRSTAERVLDWIAENVPEITPQSIFDEYIGAGVGVNLPTGAPIGSGTVFVPGIPGLPSSSPNMVIGTVDEVMQDILEGNLPGVIGDIAEDPVGGIEAAVEGAADDAEEVTLGDLLGSGVDLGIGDDEVSDIFTEEGQTTDYGAGLNDGETEDILAGVGGATATATGTEVQRPSGDFTGFMASTGYTPVAIPKAIVPSLFSEYLT